MNKIIHQIHLGVNPPSPEIQGYMDGVRKMCPDFEYKLWTEDNVAELGLQPFQWEHSSFAGSSNIIRLHALKVLGGCYLDTDVELLRPLDKLVTNNAFVARQPNGVFCNAAMGAIPNHPWIIWMIENHGDQRIHDAAYACHLIEGSPRDDVTEIPTETFYSWGHDSQTKELHPDALGIHHWKGSWLTSE